MPAYCAESYICKSIESVLKQTYRNFELIIINDGSTDNTFSVCDSYAKKYDNIKIVNKVVNEGVKQAVIDGVKISEGDYICFIDSDDEYDKDFLLTINEKLNFKKFDMIAFSYDIVDENHNKIDEYVMQNCIYEVQDNITNCVELALPTSTVQFITPARWNKVFKASVLKKVVDNLSAYPLKKAEDFELVINMLFKIQNVCCLENKLYFYLIRNGSISNTIKNYNPDIYEFLKSIDKLFEQQEKHIYFGFFKLATYTSISEVKNYIKNDKIDWAKDLLKNKFVKKSIKKIIFHSNSIRESIYLIPYYLNNMFLIKRIEKLISKRSK